MRIKRLELHGFKSFVDRTTLVFPTGLTAVVGPNGCGKSNLVDAIRWAMGEMGARRLRGKSLEDVIFNGSESRKPMGMAEVTVVFDNAGGSRDLGAFAASPEIQVTRRLYRNGDSEYLLNRVPCRLKDIVTLFLDTGVGRDAYSIIEQGRVDALVNSKPTDRRIVFEEVAGIHKYRHRREEAQRKMESTTQNLLRVSDILEEVERRMRSLKRQAGKAERYKAARAEMRELDLALSGRRYAQVAAEIDETESAHAKAVARVEDLTVRMATEEASADRERETLRERESDVHDRERTVRDLDATIAQGDQRLNFLRREVAATEETVERERREHDELEARLEALRAEHEGLVRQRAELAEALERGRGTLTEREAASEAAGRAAADLDRRIEGHKSAVVDLMAAQGRLGSRLAGLESRGEELRRRDTAAEAERERIAAQRAELEARNEGVSEALDRARADRDGLREALARVDASLAASAESERALARERSEAKDRLADRTGRLASLRELEARFEGLGGGTQAVMRDRDAAAEGAAGQVRGLVAEYLDAPKKFEIALEAVLGNRAEAIVVEARAAGIDLARRLRARDAGRAAFVALDARAPARTAPPPAGTEGVVGRLRDLIEIKPEAAGLADALFGDAVVVDSLDRGLALWDAGGRTATFVTLDGDLLTADGTIVGGSIQSLEGGVIQRRREIKELAAEVSALEAAVRDVEERIAAQAEQRAALTDERETLRSRLQAQEIEHASLGKDLEQTLKQLSALSDRLRVLTYEREQIAQGLGEVDRNASQAREELDALEVRRAREQDAVAAAREERESFEAALRSARDAVTHAKMEVATLAERHENVTKMAAGAERGLQQIRDRIAFLQRAVHDALEQIRSRREDIAATEADIHKRIAEREGAEAARVEAAERMEETRRRLGEFETALRGTREAHRQSEADVTALMLKAQSLANTRDRLVDQVEERYLERLPELVAAGGVPERSEDDETLAARVGELRRQIDEMGEVNLTAIEEYEELSERQTFLASQKADLEEAMAELRATIAKVNATTRKLFQETFDAINEKFQDVAPRLFNGGKGYLSLTEPENLLETGVEIHIQPPGKRLQAMTLLSGGEKALTAVSLLIAIFLTKPSPFCLFDEVDAPLDEANVGRFSELIHEMSEISQFLVITHNKQTMQRADHLYGVTMQEAGVSKIVSVEMERLAVA